MADGKVSESHAQYRASSQQGQGHAATSRAYKFVCPGSDLASHDVTAAVYAAALKTALGSIGSTASMRVKEPSLLIVMCDKGHVCEYAAPDDATHTEPPPADAPVRVGRLLSTKEIDTWQALRDHVSPVKSVERSITYAKWLFGGTTSVALLAAGLATGGIPALDPRQRVVFFVAELLIALAMIAAAMCMAPKWATYNPMSPDSVDDAFMRALENQRGWLRAAAFCFALSLAVAAFVPISRQRVSPAHGLKVELAEDGSITVKATAIRLPPTARLEASVHGIARRTPADSTGALAPFASVRADSTGNAEVELAVPAILWNYDSLKVVAVATAADGALLHRDEVGVGLQRLGVKKP